MVKLCNMSLETANSKYPKLAIQWLTWLVTILLAAGIVYNYLNDLGQVAFHIDESHWIATSNQFEAFLRFNPDLPIWDESHTTLTNPPVPRYAIAIGRLIGGYGEKDLNRMWDYDRNTNFNIKVGAMPSQGLLSWSRLPMALMGIFTIGLVYLLLRRIGGDWFSLPWLVLALTNPYLNLQLRRAMAESSLMFFSVLALVACAQGIRLYTEHRNQGRFVLLASGVFVGLAASAKINAFAVLGGILVAITLLLWRQKGKFQNHIGGAGLAWAIVITSAIFTFWASYPYLWANPVGRTIKMINNRVSEMSYQSGNRGDDAFENAAEKWMVMPQRIWADYAGVRFPGSLPLNLGLTLLGMGLLAQRSFCWWKGNTHGAKSLVLLLVGVTASVPVAATMLDWDRYYLYPVFFSLVYSAVAIGWLLQSGTKWLGGRLARSEVQQNPA